MTNQTINIGSQPNDGTGDSVYVAFQKVNANFQEVYTLLGFGAGFSFLRLKESPTSLQPNALLQVNAVGTKFLNKLLVAGTGMNIELTTSTIIFINTSSSLVSDGNPQLSADLDGQNAFSLITNTFSAQSDKRRTPSRVRELPHLHCGDCHGACGAERRAGCADRIRAPDRARGAPVRRNAQVVAAAKRGALSCMAVPGLRVARALERHLEWHYGGGLAARDREQERGRGRRPGAGRRPSDVQVPAVDAALGVAQHDDRVRCTCARARVRKAGN